MAVPTKCTMLLQFCCKKGCGGGSAGVCSFPVFFLFPFPVSGWINKKKKKKIDVLYKLIRSLF